MYKYVCHTIIMYVYFAGGNVCTMNVHLLRHLPECVQNWGPLWAYLCFPFKSLNGHLKTHFHGTRCINAQVRRVTHNVCICAYAAHACTLTGRHVTFSWLYHVMLQVLPESPMKVSSNTNYT